MSMCENCKSHEEEKDPKFIPFVSHDKDMARLERTNKRLWILLLVMLVLLVGTNAAWIYYESQFVDESWTFEANTDNGGTAIANGDGEVNYYGESKSDQENPNP